MTARARAILGLRLGVTLLALALLVHLYDARQAARLMAEAGPWAFVAAFVVYGACVTTAALKWRLLQPDVPLPTLMHAMVAFCFYAILPSGQLGAEVGKFMIIKAVRPQAQRVLSAIFIDKILGVASLLLLCAGGLVFTRQPVPSWQPALVGLLGLACIGALGLVALSDRLPAGDPGRNGVMHRSWRAGLATLSDARHALHRPGALLGNLLLGVVVQSCVVGVYLVFAAAMGMNPEFAQLLAIVAIANLAPLLPISIGGFGVREVGLTSLLTTAHLASGEQSIALGFAAMIIFLAWAAVGAVVELAMLLRSSRGTQSSS